MSKPFKHPLARSATTTKMRQRDGGEQEVLLVVTTLELDAGARGFNARNVERLHAAAQAFVAETEGVEAYALVNRPKQWGH